MDLLLGALVVSVPAALIAWRLRVVTAGGAVAGFLCAAAIYIGTLLAGIAVLGTALILTASATRVRWAHKVALGIAEDPHGRRDARSVAANCGVGAIAALLAAFSDSWSGEAGSMMVVAAIAAGASDTVASEIGKAFGARPRSFPTFRRVAAGTPGAISIAGTIAGALAAAVIAWPAVVLWLLTADRVPVIVLACTVGSLVESALATRFERRGVLGNHTLNVLNTLIAAALAAWWVNPRPA
jgi:uncharacterized protein (TIGR00297 family)